MAKWTSPGRFVVRGSSLTPQETAELISDARKVAGDLENQLRLGGITYGSRTVKLRDGVKVNVSIASNFEGQPIVQARILVESSAESEDETGMIAGVVWQYDLQHDLLFVGRSTSPVEFQYRTNNKASLAELTLAEGVNVTPYIPKPLKKKIEAGEVDWRGFSGSALTWNGPNSRSILPLQAETSVLGTSVYSMGRVVYRGVAGEYVLGAARFQGALIIAVYQAPNFVLLRRFRGETTTIGFLSGIYNGVQLYPRSPAFFSPDGSTARMVVDNLGAPLDDYRNEVWGIVSFSSAGGVSLAGMKRPRPRSFSTSAEFNYVGEEFDGLTGSYVDYVLSNSALITVSVNDISADVGHSWATVADKREIAVDFDPATGDERTLYMEAMPPEVVSAAYSYTQNVDSSREYTSTAVGDPIEGYLAGPSTLTLQNTDTLIDSLLDVRYGRMRFLYGALELYVSEGHRAFQDYTYTIDTVHTVSASYSPGEEEATLTLTQSESVVGASIEANPHNDAGVFFADARYGVVGVYDLQSVLFSNLSDVRSRAATGVVTDLYDGGGVLSFFWPNLTVNINLSRWQDSQEKRAVLFRSLYPSETSSLVRETEFTNTTPFLASYTVIVGDSGAPLFLPDEEPQSVAYYGPFTQTSLFSITYVGLQSFSDTFLTNALGGNNPSFVGSGARSYFVVGSSVNCASAQNPLFYVDLLHVDIISDLPELSSFSLNGAALADIVFPIGGFEYKLKSV